MRPSPPIPRSPQAFSLIEVVLAIAIVALVMLPVVALLGTAIDTSRDAFSKVNDSRIGAELVGELQQADWDDLMSWNGREIYYDYQGQRLPEGTRDDAVFTARIKILQSRAGLSLGSASAGGNPHLRQVLVAVSSRPGEAGAQALDLALSGTATVTPGVHLVRSIVVNADR